jgi:hypothetical protein
MSASSIFPQAPQPHMCLRYRFHVYAGARIIQMGIHSIPCWGVTRAAIAVAEGRDL